MATQRSTRPKLLDLENIYGPKTLKSVRAGLSKPLDRIWTSHIQTFVSDMAGTSGMTTSESERLWGLVEGLKRKGSTTADGYLVLHEVNKIWLKYDDIFEPAERDRFLELSTDIDEELMSQDRQIRTDALVHIWMVSDKQKAIFNFALKKHAMTHPDKGPQENKAAAGTPTTPTYCTKCGAQSIAGDLFCHTCGAPLNVTSSLRGPTPGPTPPVQNQPAISSVSVNVQGTAARQKTSGLAVASLVLGLLGISILALIFGAVAMGQTGKNPNLSGKGLATAGFVLGLLGFLVELFVVVFAVGLARSL